MTEPTTTAPGIDEREHWTLLAAAIKASMGSDAVYDYSEVPGGDNADAHKRPRLYAVLEIDRRYVEPRRAGRVGRSGWRATVRAVGRTPDEARWVLLRATEALEELRFEIGGEVSTPVTLESTLTVIQEDTYYTGLTNWTYAL